MMVERILSLVLSLGNYRDSSIGEKQESLTELAIVSGPLAHTRGYIKPRGALGRFVFAQTTSGER
jgi:hypothetical protein